MTVRPVTRWSVIRIVLRHRNLLAGTVILALVALPALLSFVWTPYPPDRMQIAVRLADPSLDHWFGTDHFGRDTLSMIMVGARNSILIGLIAVGVGMLFGVPLGLIAAEREGWIDDVIGRATDLAFAFPALLSAILVTALMGPGAVNAVIAIGIFNIAVFVRVTRASARRLWRREFVRAAVALGRSDWSISLIHVLPNLAGTLTVQATVSFAVAILAEAGLSYLGLGIQPPAPSLGKMLNDAQTFMFTQPAIAIFPGTAIALAVLGLNLLGDGLRDLLDPRSL